MRRLSLIPVVVSVLVAAAACGTETEPPAAIPSPSATYTVPQRAYLDALAEIDAGLAANEDRALGRAENTCADIAAGEIKGDALADRVVERLSGGDAQINREQASKAIDLMRNHIC